MNRRHMVMITVVVALMGSTAMAVERGGRGGHDGRGHDGRGHDGRGGHDKGGSDHGAPSTPSTPAASPSPVGGATSAPDGRDVRDSSGTTPNSDKCFFWSGPWCNK